MALDIITAKVEQIAKNADLSHENTPKRADVPLQGKTPLETKTGRLQNMADANSKLRKQSKAILTEYSENRRRAGDLRNEIAKGSNDGTDVLVLFEKAVKCIECMTGDKAFYTTVMQNIKNR